MWSQKANFPWTNVKLFIFICTCQLVSMSVIEGDKLPDQKMSIVAANNYLAVNLHRLLAEEKGNVFFSPFSISTAMAMLLCAAEGETESELKVALGYGLGSMERGEIPSAFEQQMTLLLEKQNSYTMSCANSMLIQKEFELKEEYKKIISASFGALISEVDFKNESKNAVKQVNDWVKDKTNKMIPELVQSFEPDTALVWLNAIYFKGTWLEKFDQKYTYPQRFFNKGSERNVKQVDMMHIRKKCLVYGNEYFRALQLPYEGENVAMLILLPHEKEGLDSMEAGLNPSFLQDIKQNFRSMKVWLYMPKFRLQYAKNLIPYFQRFGINRVFNSGEAELGFASDSPGLYVDEILHKAVLEVNEEGSEAAAVTMVSSSFRSGPPRFVVDHPFAFIIYDTKSDLILFMGRVDEL